MQENRINVQYKEFDEHYKENLINFLSSHNWPFHSTPLITKEKLLLQYDNGYFTGSGIKTFLILKGTEITGVIRVFDLGDDTNDGETPLFDIKICEDERGKGIGKNAVKWLCDYIFKNYPNKLRFEATTRIDNISMRKVLEACGFLKEAHFRQAWPDKDGNRYDCAGYAILRNDWETGLTSKMEFES